MVFWTPERDNTLKEMRAGGYTTGQIADALRCTRNAVIGRARRKKFPTPNGPRGNSLRADRLSTKLSPRPKSIEAKREKPIPPKPVLRETPRDPKYTAKQAAREPLPGSNPVASIIEATGCRWPVGRYPYHWCNQSLAEGAKQPYCEAHRQIGTRREVKEQPQHIGDVAARVVAEVRRKMDEARQ